MELRNKSHHTDSYILENFHWVRQRMVIPREHIELLVVKTLPIKTWMPDWMYNILHEASWRGRWVHYMGWGHKIKIRVSIVGRDAELKFCRALAHELGHSIGDNEKEAKKREDFIERQYWIRKGR